MDTILDRLDTIILILGIIASVYTAIKQAKAKAAANEKATKLETVTAIAVAGVEALSKALPLDISARIKGKGGQIQAAAKAAGVEDTLNAIVVKTTKERAAVDPAGNVIPPPAPPPKGPSSVGELLAPALLLLVLLGPGCLRAEVHRTADKAYAEWTKHRRNCECSKAYLDRAIKDGYDPAVAKSAFDAHANEMDATLRKLVEVSE